MANNSQINNNLLQASNYANAVINNEIKACVYIKQACKNFLLLLENSKYEYKALEVDKIIMFINSLQLTEASAGTYFMLQPWQTIIVCQVFGFYFAGTNRRVCKYLNISVGRKNGKSMFVNAIVCYFLIFGVDEQIVLSANSREQIKNISLKQIKNYCTQIDPKQKNIKQQYNKVKCLSNELITTASDHSKLDGLNVSLGIIEELGAAPDDSMYSVIKSSMGSRLNPLLITVSTANFNTDSFYYSLLEYNKKVLAGEIEDEATATYIYTLDKDDDYQDESLWIKPNPNINISIYQDFLKSEVNKANNNPIEKHSVLVKNFNCFLLNKNEENKYIDMEYIIKSFDKTISITDSMFENKPCYVGIDLASNQDLATITYQFYIDNKYYYFNRAFLPEYNLGSGVNRLWYKKLAQENFITITSGNVCDYDYILNDLIKTRETHPIKLVSYDPYNSSQFIIQAEQEGFNCKQFNQGKLHINKPAKELERLIMSDKVCIEYNPLTQWCFNNCVVVYGANDNIGLDKTNRNNKIDIVASTVNALGGYMEAPKFNNEMF